MRKMNSGICRHMCARAVCLARAAERSEITAFALQRGQELSRGLEIARGTTVTHVGIESG